MVTRYRGMLGYQAESYVNRIKKEITSANGARSPSLLYLPPTSSPFPPP